MPRLAPSAPLRFATGLAGRSASCLPSESAEQPYDKVYRQRIRAMVGYLQASGMTDIAAVGAVAEGIEATNRALPCNFRALP